MNLELVTVGTELLLGFTVDTNGAEIARTLGAEGVRVVRRTSVGDTAGEIQEAVGAALRRTGAVIITGGLGPTRDDVTKRAVTELLGLPLVFDETVWTGLVERFRRLGRVPAERNRSQAEVPRGAVVLPNRRGTAPGLWIEVGQTVAARARDRTQTQAQAQEQTGTALSSGLVVMLPGVPAEMRHLLVHEVVPRVVRRLREDTGLSVIRSAVVRTTGIAESSLAERLGELEASLAPLTLAYLPGLTGVDLRLTAWRLSPEEAAQRLRAGVARVRAGAGDYAYGEDDDDDLAAVVLDRLRARGWRLAVAESCTGGLIGARLTAIPGSSEVFVGGTIAYDNQVKLAQLDVPAPMLARHGAVSEPVAGAMAAGAAKRFGVEAAVAVTGIAGPGGGSEAKPVGTVCLGSVFRGDIETSTVVLPGSRDEVRARAAQLALFWLYRRLLSFKI